VHFRCNLGLGRPLVITSLAFLFAGMVTAGSPQAPGAAPSRTTEHISDSEQTYYANARPYMDEPPKQLSKRIPQLKDLQPAQSQQQLAEILRRAGGQVDDFFHHITDLTAREEIFLTRLRQEKPYTKPEMSGEHVRDSYLILRHADKVPAEVIEYRTDTKGANFDQVVVQNGFLVTSGFALSCNYFSTGFQSESTFRYLGDEKIGQQDLYVVAFAQQPGKATLSVRMRGRGGNPAHILVQGVAWICWRQEKM